MPGAINPGEIFKAVKDPLTKLLHSDVTTASEFVRDQLQDIERNTIMFSEMELAGEFDDDPERRKALLKLLERSTHTLADTVRAMAVVEVEKIWNTVVKAVWDTLDKATGLAVPRPPFL